MSTEHQSHSTPITESRVKVWVDGCFDLFHYGHANAIRQSRAMADYLVAGCHSDEAISENKGPPVVTQTERVQMLMGCRWVDQVVPDAPYTTEIAFISRYGIDFVAHGDDVTTDATGLDSYRLVKEAGLYKQFPRTAGVSTTDALSRILELSPSSPVNLDHQKHLGINNDVLNAFLISASTNTLPPVLKILKSSVNLKDAPNDVPSPRSDGHTLALVRPLSRPTLYLHGPFDLFCSHDLLQFEKLSQNGQVDLVVGIWGGDDANKKLHQECIWSFQERALAVLQCRYVTGLVIPAIPPSDLTIDQNSNQGFDEENTLMIRNVRESKFCKDFSSAVIQQILDRKDQFLARQERKSSKRIIEKRLEQNQN